MNDNMDDEMDNEEIEGGVQEVNDDLLEDSVMEEIDGGDILEEKPEWMTRSNTINPMLFPLLSRFGATISDVELSTVLSELVRFTKDLKKVMNFKYKNGKKGLLLEIPMNISSEYGNF